MRTKMKARSRNSYDSKLHMAIGTCQPPEQCRPDLSVNRRAKIMDGDPYPVTKPDIGLVHMTKPAYRGEDILHLGESIYHGKRF